MTTPQIFVAFAPRGAGLLCAVIYVVRERDVYGWWIGYKDAAFPSAFFKLENFFSAGPTAFFATEGSDLYGGWKFDYSSDPPRLGKPIPVDEDIAHELDRMQDEFVAEWLFLRGDEGAEDEVAAYRQQELPLQDVSIKARKLHKFNTDDVVWRYYSKDLRGEIIEYLASKWPLDYGRD